MSIAFVVASIPCTYTYSKGDYICLKKHSAEFCNLESDIEWQHLSKKDIDDIYKNFEYLDKRIKFKYSKYTYKNNKYSGHTLIYNSEENGKHVYILRLWFKDKSCDTTVVSYPIVWSDDSSIWCQEKRYTE